MLHRLIHTVALLSFLTAASVQAQNPPSHVVGKMIWDGRLVQYEVVNGHIVIDGDVSIGTLEEIASASAPAHPDSDVTPAVPANVWPTGVVPYEIDPAIPNPQRVIDAVAQWTQKTPLHFIPHTTEKTFLRFVRDTSTAGACRTERNINGGQQTIDTLDSCPAGMLAHEIGHAVGLNHEHQRADRNFYVQIFPELLEKIRDSDLNLEVSNGVDMGPYDFGSLMHYGRYYTLRTRNSTMESIPAGIVMGLLTTLSDGDIDQITRLYGTPPKSTTISTNPPGLQVIVDGATITAPQSFNWAAGSTHTVNVAAPPQVLSSDANSRYIFGRWSDNQPQAHTITASAAVTVFEVSFVQQVRLTTGVTPSNSGTVTVSPSSPDGFYVINTMVTLTAAPASGFRFLVWGPSGILGTYHGYSDNPVTFPLKSPLTYTASFTTNQPTTIASNPPDVQVTVDGLTPVALRSFDYTPGSTHTIGAATVYNQWSTVRQVFTGWSDGGAATHTITVPSTLPTTITANFKTQYLLVTQVSGSGTITVSPASADGFYDPGTVVQITATPSAGFKLLNWSGDLQGQAGTQNLTMSDEMVVTATFARPFVIAATGILNSASYQSTPLSPGEIVVIFGLEIGAPLLTTLQLNSSGNVATLLAGTRVLFDGNAAPIVYTSLNQIAAIVPYSVSGHATTNVQVQLNGLNSNTVTLPVGTAAPGLYSFNSSGLGGGAILNQDATVNTPANPAAKGSVIVLFATGEGQTNPSGVDGKPAVVPIPKPLQPVGVLFGGPAGILLQASDLLYAGSAPGETAGVLQVNVTIPLNAPSGNVPISVIVGSQRSPDWLTVAIR